jgi:hypothetical protein
MPGYVSRVLSKFQNDSPKHPYQTPSWYVKSVYSAKTQYTTTDETPPIIAQQCLTIQKVTGSVLYYARAVYPTILIPLNDIATEQTKATEKIQAATNQMLDYLATHPDATIRYHASDMILHIHSDASYLSVSNYQSRLGGLFSWETNPPSKKHLTAQSSASLPLSKTSWPQLQNQKLECASTTPKVAPHSESHSPSWATHNHQRLCERITPLHTAS